MYTVYLRQARLKLRFISIRGTVHRAVLPRGGSSVPRGDSSVRRGDSSVPRGDSSVPRGGSSVPRGDSSIPRRDSSVDCYPSVHQLHGDDHSYSRLLCCKISPISG